MKKSRPAPKDRSAPVNRTRRPQPAAPTSPPRDPFPFPPEILTSILSHIGCDIVIVARNALLAPLALVSRSWQAATYSLLYGHLGINWLAGNVTRLLRSFEQNSNLLPLVRHLETRGVAKRAWINCWIEDTMADPVLERERWEKHCYENDIDHNEASRAWSDEGEGGLSDDLFYNWEIDLREGGVATKAWHDAGHDKWKATEDRMGIHLLLDLLEAAPNLRSLVISAFDYDRLPLVGPDRGPFNTLTALETPGESLVLQSPPTLSSIVMSRAPNLRRLSGSMEPLSSQGPLTPFPSLLSQLEVDNFIFHRNPTLSKVLHGIQTSLRSLKLPLAGPDGLAAATPYLSSLDHLYIRAHDVESDELATSLASILPSLLSLRHLHLNHILLPHADILLSSLPPTLSSITFDTTLIRDFIDEHGADLQEVLEVLKKNTSPRPLRVTLPVPSRERDAIMDAFADKFREEGMALVLI